MGGVRDYVLGVLLLDGRGQLMHFGGQVMKNVAGYDVSRLVAGSWGALGALCEVSLKVLPMPVASVTLRFDMRQAEALDHLHAWAGQPLPLNASVWWRDTLAVRLRGANAAVAAAVRRLGRRGDSLRNLPARSGTAFATSATSSSSRRGESVERDQRALWRLWRCRPPRRCCRLSTTRLVEWGGAQRWVVAGAEDTLVITHRAERAGGSAFRVSGGIGDGAGYATPLAPALLAIHRRLRESFDPQGVFVPGRPMRF